MTEPSAAEVLLLARVQEQARALAVDLAETPFTPATRRAVERWLVDAAGVEVVWQRLRAMPVERVHTLAARVLGGERVGGDAA